MIVADNVPHSPRIFFRERISRRTHPLESGALRVDYSLFMDQQADGVRSGAGEDPALGYRGDEGLARRLKALACTAPLHDLDARKSQLQWAEAATYQMAEIGFQAIDFAATLNADRVLGRWTSLTRTGPRW